MTVVIAAVASLTAVGIFVLAYQFGMMVVETIELVDRLLEEIE